MKRTVFYMLAATACISLTMCAKNEQAPSENRKESIGIALDDNKISLTQGEGKLKLSWQSTDCVRVEGQTSEVYQIEAGFSAHYALFNGNYAGAGNKNVFYPGTYESSTALAARSYTGQVQDGNASTAHLEFNALASNLESITEVDFSSSNPDVKLNQAVKFVIKLPTEVTEVQSLVLQAPSKLFYTTNGGSEKTDKLVLTFKNVDVSESSQILTAYMMASWQPMNIPSGTAFTIKVLTPYSSEACCHSLVATTKKAYTWVGGNTFTFDMSSKELVHQIKGSGTQSSPYLLYDAMDMLLVKSLCTAGSKTWFKLMDDVDLAGIDWEPVNSNDPYDLIIDFNGNNHTIKNLSSKNITYASLFGVINGRVYDLNVKDAYILGGYAIGILAGYIGANAISDCHVSNVHVSGTVINDGGTANGVGGIAGRLGSYCTVDRCSADVEMRCKKKYCGGIIGYAFGTDNEITNCKSSGSLYPYENNYSVDGHWGGITGGWVEKGISVRQTIVANCISTMSISSKWAVGGIVGSMCHDGSSQSLAKDIKENAYVRACLAWNPLLEVKNTGDANYSSGGVVAYTYMKNTLENCYRRSDMEFKVGPTTVNELTHLFDQPNCSSSSPFVSGVTPGILYSESQRYSVHYDGKAYSGTASSAARSLGWDEAIWDLSGSIPELR